MTTTAQQQIHRRADGTLVIEIPEHLLPDATRSPEPNFALHTVTRGGFLQVPVYSHEIVILAESFFGRGMSSASPAFNLGGAYWFPSAKGHDDYEYLVPITTWYNLRPFLLDGCPFFLGNRFIERPEDVYAGVLSSSGIHTLAEELEIYKKLNNYGN